MKKKTQSAFLPKRIEQLNFAHLHNSQLWVMSDWMGCRRALGTVKGTNEQREFLKARCMENVERSQKGYEIIVLGQDTPSSSAPGAIPEEMEKRMYQVLTDVVLKHKESMGETASTLINSAVQDMKNSLALFAREEVKRASENARPIVVKEKGKKDRKVKGILPAEFERIMQLASQRLNIMLVGPSGCGKTYIAAKLAEALGLEFGAQSCSAGISESQFVGWLLPTGKGGEFVHIPAVFVERYEKGGVFLLDEMDSSDANLLTFLNNALANGFFFLPQRHKKPLVKRHPDFIAIGAMNTFGHGADAMYVGRNQLDASTLDRFRVGMITMDYSKEVEESLAQPELLEWAWKLRAAIRKKSLRRIMSTRTIEDMSKMHLNVGWQQPEWEQAYFADWTSEEKNLVKEAMAQMGAA